MNKHGENTKNRRFFALSAVLAVICATLSAPVSASACLIPVFQYALENWSADPYRVVIQPSLTGADDEALAGLDRLKSARAAGANIELEIKEADTGMGGDNLGVPRMNVFYPRRSGVPGTILTQTLNPEAVGGLLDSPARRQIVRHLLDRKAAVWVFLTGGHRRNDRSALKTIETETDRLKRILKVYVPEDGEYHEEIQTDIDFAVVRVDRDDPKERTLVEMLLGLEPDLRDFKNQPMVFPVYGRGIALYALVGDGINPGTILEAGSFLTGPCSCQVRSANPGVDLLLLNDWESSVERRARVEAPLPAGGAAGFLERMREAERKLSDEP